MSSIFNTSVLSIGFIPSSLGSLPGFLISSIISFSVTCPTSNFSLNSAACALIWANNSGLSPR